MHYTQHTSNNGVLGAGLNKNTSALPITSCIEDGIPMIQSFWLPNKEELETLNKGLPIMISQMGMTIAPMRVEVAATK